MPSSRAAPRPALHPGGPPAGKARRHRLLVKTYPHLSDAQIKPVGTTKNTIGAIRERTHWNMANLQPRDPVLLGICKQADLDAALVKAAAANPEAAAKVESNQAMFDENQPRR